MNKKMKSLLYAGVFTGVVMNFVGCSTVPMSDRKQLMLSDPANENAIASTTYAELIKTDKPSPDESQQALLKRVYDSIRDAAGNIDYTWDCSVLVNKDAHAFCLPGGKVVVYTAMMRSFANEAELAAIVAHEVAHSIARHDGERMSWCYLRVVGTLGLSLLGNDYSKVVNGPGSEYSASIPYDITCEKEADLIGLNLMAKAGYNPQAAIDYLKRNDSSRKVLYSTVHPCDSERLSAIQSALTDAMNVYQEAPNKKGFGVSMKDGRPL